MKKFYTVRVGASNHKENLHSMKNFTVNDMMHVHNKEAQVHGHYIVKLLCFNKIIMYYQHDLAILCRFYQSTYRTRHLFLAPVPSILLWVQAALLTKY